MLLKMLDRTENTEISVFSVQCNSEIPNRNSNMVNEVVRALELGPRSGGDDYLSAILAAFTEDKIIDDVGARL